MNVIELKQVEHQVRIGQLCGSIAPNVVDDSLLKYEDEAIGFYIKDLSQYSLKAHKLAEIANIELNSSRVPKDELRRISGLVKGSNYEVKQYSTILGSVPPKPRMSRAYANRSIVHQSTTAQTFIKAMLMLCGECEKIIKQITPHIYQKQLELIETNIAPKWRFGKLFTSSISNNNIAAPYHIDKANLVGCVNVIVAKRHKSIGVNTTVPDYNATFDSADSSLLVYPAWRNIHGVTPIIPQVKHGYRNTLVFYALKEFVNLK